MSAVVMLIIGLLSGFAFGVLVGAVAVVVLTADPDAYGAPVLDIDEVRRQRTNADLPERAPGRLILPELAPAPLATFRVSESGKYAVRAKGTIT